MDLVDLGDISSYACMVNPSSCSNGAVMSVWIVIALGSLTHESLITTRYYGPPETEGLLMQWRNTLR